MRSNNTTSTTTRLELTHGLTALEVGARLRSASDELGRNKRVLAFYLFDDLTVTTEAQLEAGTMVVVTGKLTKDKDFGMGYFYPVIIEQAKIDRE